MTMPDECCPGENYHAEFGVSSEECQASRKPAGAGVTAFKPGDKQLATVLRRAVHPDAPHDFDAWPADIQRVWGRAAQVAVEFLSSFNVEADQPAPYTEPRKGDKVAADIIGEVSEHGLCVGARIVLTSTELREHAADGRVRLVQAAAPSWEPGRIYRSPSVGGVLFAYVPVKLGPTDFPMEWYRLGSDPCWLDSGSMPADLVPCDVVPREATP